MSDQETLPVYTSVEGGQQRPGLVRRKKRGRCLCIACVVLLIILLAAITLLVLLLLVVGNQPPRVQTTCGSVEGEFDTPNNVFIFKGIPFAKPPNGNLRWKPPEPLTRENGSCWEGTRDAKQYPLQCVQQDLKTMMAKGSEDCLYLNVFSPSVDPMTPLPVMVWIHGGYLQYANSFTPGHAPDIEITKKLNVVFVSIQYRLNAFGFLVLDELPGKGNYGYLDQIMALEWVRDNIRSFGGDPKQVTIFGSSSGGTSVWSLMMTPKAKGLFQKVWMLSASPIFNKTIADAKKENEFFLERPSVTRHCKNITESCLMSIPSQDVIEAIYPTWNVLDDSMDLPKKGYFEPALPVIDGDLFPDSPFNLWDAKSKGNYSDVPVLIGTTAQELDINPTPYAKFPKEFLSWTSSELYNYVAGLLDDFGNATEGNMSVTDAVWSLYPFTTDAALTFSTMASDVRVICGNNILAEKAAAALASPVYRYVVDGFPSSAVHPFGNQFPSKYAFHTWDSYAFFGAFDLLFGNGGGQDSDYKYADIVQTEVMSFVHDGHPRHPNWQTYPNTTALLSQEIHFTPIYHQDKCNFWMNNGFFGYSWIN